MWEVFSMPFDLKIRVFCSGWSLSECSLRCKNYSSLKGPFRFWICDLGNQKRMKKRQCASVWIRSELCGMHRNESSVMNSCYQWYRDFLQVCCLLNRFSSISQSLPFSVDCEQKHTSPRCVLLLLPPAMKLGKGYVFTGVYDSVHRGEGGVCLSACWDITPHQADTPWSRYPPGADTQQTPPQEQTLPPGSRHNPWSRHPPEQTPQGADTSPPAQSILGDTVNARAVRIILECNLVVG